MGTTLRFIHPEPRTLELSLPHLSEVRNTPAVDDELAKLRTRKKPQVQLFQEMIREIDNLHECVDGECVECWNTWPCGTHKIIHGV